MKIQILGLRRYYNKQKQKELVYDAFFERGWRAESVPELFANIKEHLKNIPQGEHWNLYYTAANCLEKKGRKMARQEVMPFDIDGIDVEKRRDYVEPILQALSVQYEETGILFTGNGLQFIIGLKEGFESTDYFDKNRHHYRAVCAKINRGLREAGLPGEADPTVFSAARILRLPLTKNCKPNKPERIGELFQGRIARVEWQLERQSGIPQIAASEHINESSLKKYPAPDTDEILSECRFLAHCKDNPAQVRESEWYAMLSVVGRLPDGSLRAHEYSSGHPGYTHSETEDKLTQALQASGPRTCKSINATWGRCSECPHFKKITSPITIQGANYIKTQNQGFHDCAVDKEGNPKLGRPNFEDLRKFFNKEHHYKCIGGSKICVVWNGKFWEEFEDAYLENFAQTHFKPTADDRMRNEFRKLVHCTNLTDPQWFVHSINRRINFANGVLHIDSGEFGAHSPERGFRYVLPYDYDPEAKAPRFQQFLHEITGGNDSLSSVLIEFAGYAFSNDECWAEKAMIMVGEGSNGKSTFINVLKELAGSENYSGLTLNELRKETNRAHIDGTLFNLAEETPTNAMTESTFFKNAVTGGDILIRQLYKQGYTIPNRCKLMFACNELPDTRDCSKGFFRRLLVVPFNETFEGSTKDSFLKHKLFKELPGIFNIILEGYKNLKRQGKFTVSNDMDQEIEDYRLEMDSVAMWSNDSVTVLSRKDQGSSVLSKMYDSYKYAVERKGGYPLPYIKFSRRLGKLIPKYKDRCIRSVIEGRKETVVQGILFDTLEDF